MSAPIWPADHLERWPIDRLVPFARNARTHSDANIAAIAASIREWGWTTPVLAQPDGTIIAGHGRVLAARQLGIAEIPVIVAHGWSEAQIRAYVLADNKLPELAGWDMDLLKVELGELRDADFDLSLIGFSEDELAGLLVEETEGLTDPDDVPEVPEEPVTVAGDVWVMGRHRLTCGSSTEADTVERVLNGVKPHLMVTDPPYGVKYDPNWRNEADRANGKPYGARAVGKVQNDDKADWREAWALFPGEVAYVWCAPGPLQHTVFASLTASAFEPRQQIIWAKPRFVIGRGHYHYQHEVCWYAVRKGGKGYWSGDRTQSTLWTIDHRKSDTGHGTQKPVECMKRPIENNSSPGQAVYEPFSGSGTTIIAAEMTGRACHAIELDASYVDVAVKRWMVFAGKDAILESTGQTFAQVAEERLGSMPERIERATMAAA